MARVNMNSPISNQPATVGPNTAITIGLATRNRIMTCLYQTGALPRKFWVKPEKTLSGIAEILLEVVAGEVCNRQLLPSLIYMHRLPSRGLINAPYLNVRRGPKLASGHLKTKKPPDAGEHNGGFWHGCPCLFHRHTLGQVSGLVHISALKYC